MPRTARIVGPGLAHHVTQRGNNRQDVFFVDDDRRVYLDLLRDHAQRFGLSVLGYCLMTNHVHVIAIPDQPDSLARAIGRTNFRYTQYVNRLHGRSGHLWQNRFFSCMLDDGHTWNALRYVERNPVRARIVRLPWRYAWSSATAHVEGADPTGVLDLDRWRRFWQPHRWRDALRERQDDETCALLRLRTHTGRPLGTDRFIAKLETKLGRRLRPLNRGRPRKIASKAAPEKHSPRRKAKRMSRK